MTIERGDIIGVILGKIMEIRLSRYGSDRTEQGRDWTKIQTLLIFSTGFDNRNRLGIGSISEIFFPQKETFEENE